MNARSLITAAAFDVAATGAAVAAPGTGRLPLAAIVRRSPGLAFGRALPIGPTPYKK